MRSLALLAALAALLMLAALLAPADAASRTSSSLGKHASKLHAAKKAHAHAHAHAHKKSHAAAHATDKARDPTENADEDDEDDDGNEGFDDDDNPGFDESKYVNGREVFRRRRRDARRRWMRRHGMRTIYSSATAPPMNCQCAGMQVRCGSPCSRRHVYVKAPYTYVSPLSNTPAANSVSDGRNVYTRFNGAYSSSADVPSGFNPSSASSWGPSGRPPYAYSEDSGDDNPYMYFGRAYTADWPAALRHYHTPWEWRQRMLEQLGPKPRISDSLRAVDSFNHKYVRRQRLHDIWANLKKHENDHYDWEEAEIDAASPASSTTNTACNAGDTCRQSYLDGNTNSCQQNSECYRPGDENYR